MDAETHITTRVMGTFGYLTPKYASSGKLARQIRCLFLWSCSLRAYYRAEADQTQPIGEESLVEWGSQNIGMTFCTEASAFETSELNNKNAIPEEERSRESFDQIYEAVPARPRK